MAFRVQALIGLISDVFFGTLGSGSKGTLIGPQDGVGNRLAGKRTRPALEIYLFSRIWVWFHRGQQKQV